MALELPYVHVRVGGRPRVDSMTRPPPLKPADLADLLALDRQAQAKTPPGDRALPLESGGWAVGRGGYGGVTWRILTPIDVDIVNHPAWLWRSSRWFDPTAPSRGPIPQPVALRAQLDPAHRLGGGPAQTAGLLAMCVRAVRARQLPVAIVVDPAKVADPAPSGRWFLLALLTILPKALSATLRISTFEHNPDPESWDIVICQRPTPGFHNLKPESHPALGADLPASFVLERLLADDPETVEEASEWAVEGASDPWAAAIRERRPAGTITSPGRTPEGAEPRRLRLNTPEAWLSLSNRSADKRSQIVTVWLDRQPEPPSELILEAVATIRPPGRDTEAWCESLLAWAEDGPCATKATLLLLQAVDTEPMPHEPSTRASLFTEAFRLLLKHARYDEALSATNGTTAQALLEAGAGRVVVQAWARLPANRRTLTALDALVDRLLHSEDGDDAANHLWLSLMVEDQETQADRVLQNIAAIAATEPNTRIEALIESLVGSPQAMRWVGHVARVAPPERLWDLIAPVTSGPSDPLWEHCVDVRAQTSGPEDRIGDLVGLPQPQVARNERELRRVAASVRVWHFPDASVSEGSSRLAQLPNRSPIWAWLSLCAATPEQTPSSLLAESIDLLCERPPSTSDERGATSAMAEGLGMAPGWTASQHAECLMRLVLAPDPTRTSYGSDLARALVRGVSRRGDASGQMALISDQLCALPPEHPAVVAFLNRMLPLAFTRGVPRDYLHMVQPSTWPPGTRDAWARIMESLGPAPR